MVDPFSSREESLSLENLTVSSSSSVMFPDLSKSSGCIEYFFCLKLEVLYRWFLLSDMPQPLDITLKAFQTR